MKLSYVCVSLCVYIYMCGYITDLGKIRGESTYNK